MISWRTAAIGLAIVCGVQRWQSCTRSDSPTIVERVGPTRFLPQALAAPSRSPSRATRTFFGVRPPAWAAHLLPQAGEKMGAYRDRIVPLAQLAIAPQRARVARMREQLDDHQRTTLDAAATAAATEIEARVTSAILDGELNTLEPMTGVTMARELLDIVDRGNTQFMGSLSAEQRTQLAANRFDFADYLLFSTHWEDALKR
jgi:hypothetical protein